MYPNSCNSPGNRCPSNKVINICGDRPGWPGSKGRGGSHGVGGSGGFKVIVNVTSSTPSVTSYLAGENGISGKDGTDGRRGTWGAVEVLIGDRYCSSCVERICKANSNVETGRICSETSLMGSNENNVSLPLLLDNKTTLQFEHPDTEHENVSIKTFHETLDYSLTEFKPYVKNLLDNAEKNLNLFNRQDVTTFIDFVKSNPVLV